MGTCPLRKLEPSFWALLTVLVGAIALFAARCRGKRGNGGDRYARFFVHGQGAGFSVDGHPGLHLLEWNPALRERRKKARAFLSGEPLSGRAIAVFFVSVGQERPDLRVLRTPRGLEGCGLGDAFHRMLMRRRGTCLAKTALAMVDEDGTMLPLHASVSRAAPCS